VGPQPLSALPAARLRVLEALESRGAPVTIAELTRMLGGHPNTVRAHLAELMADGLADRVASETVTRGRPAHDYRITQGGALVAEANRVARPVATNELVSAIAEHLATSPDSQAQARSIGRLWAAQVQAGRPAAPPGDPTDELMTMLSTAGFSPVEEVASHEIVLRTCPVLDSAREHPEVVCTIHEGMLGAVTERSGDGTRVHLLPFARPGACVVRLAR
jgi:predicted ArsR family transcriptional regulator